MASIGVFNSLAGVYEDWFTSPLGAFVAEKEIELLLSLLQPAVGQTVLEVGSGTGYFLRPIARAGARCIGVEPSSEMLSVAQSQRSQNVNCVRGVGEALPFKDSSQDALLCMTTLEFVQDVEAMLREAARVTRPEGRLVFGVLNAASPWARARKRERGLWEEARFFTAGELEALLRPFGDVRVSYCVHVPPGMDSWPVPLMRLADWLLHRIFPRSGALLGVQVIRRSQE